MESDNLSLLFDCGDIGPSYMGGHSHNDCLSFELSVKGSVVLTNSGTGLYQGDLRSFFRSTPAHNTMMVDDYEQSELWGEHRAGRRIRSLSAERKNERHICGQFSDYRGNKYRRDIELDDKGIAFKDQAISRGSHILRQFFHLMPGYGYKRSADSVDIRNQSGETVLRLLLPATSDFLIHTEGLITNYAGEFGKMEHKEVLEVRTPFTDKCKVCMKIEETSG